MKGFMKRAGWLFLAALFILTALGITIWGVWYDSHQNKQSTTNQQNGQSQMKLEGTKLANYTPVDKVDKLQVVDTKPGTGAEATASSTVVVNYTGAVAATGVIFQSSLDSGQPFSTKLDQVIKGWKDGVPGMKAGGERRLIIPAADAYGANPPPGIPANADLVFDITLLAVQ